jgi:hypothetical protein
MGDIQPQSPTRQGKGFRFYRLIDFHKYATIILYSLTYQRIKTPIDLIVNQFL